VIGEEQKFGLEIEEQADLEDTLKGPDTIPDSCQKSYTSQELQDTGTYVMMTVIMWLVNYISCVQINCCQFVDMSAFIHIQYKQNTVQSFAFEVFMI
jgi:hypothetical protein